MLTPLLPEMTENFPTCTGIKCESIISAHAPPDDNQSIRPDVSDGKITITGSQSAMLFDRLSWHHSKTMP